MIGARLIGREALSAIIDVVRNEVQDPEFRQPAPGSRPAAHPAIPYPAQASTFDRVIDALNRLPRPCLAFGTLAMFAFAMIAPERFAERMAGLREVPEPLWWLVGGVVGFHFGAREAHHFRGRAAPAAPAATPLPPVRPDPAAQHD